MMLITQPRRKKHMSWRQLLLPLAAIGLLQTGVVTAQRLPGAERPNPRFEAAPQIGELIPDVTIVDDQGNPVNVRELASRSPYTVLTLGCLT